MTSVRFSGGRIAKSLSTAVALTLLSSGLGQAKADVLFTLNTDIKGNSATALFSAGNNQLILTVTNTISNTTSAAHAISQLSFTVAGAPTFPAPTAFTEIKGNTTDFTGSPYTTTPVDDTTGTNAVDHWSFSTASTNNVQEYDVGAGTQPNHLIVSTGSTPDASLTNTHLPSFLGSVTFYFTEAGLTSGTDLQIADFTSFRFSFGTTPEDSLALANKEEHVPPIGPQGPPAVPEPATFVMALAGLVPLAFVGLRHRRSAIASA